LLPAIGVVLALIARSKIKNSEGTRSGLGLATTALWICCVGGASYAAFAFASSIVVEREARTAANKFFKKLQDGQFTRAFLDTIDPDRRTAATPDDPYELIKSYPEFSSFQTNSLVRLYRRYGKQVEVQTVGGGSVEQAQAGFQVIQNFRLHSPEGEFDATIALTATETKKGDKTPWSIMLMGQRGDLALGVRPVALSDFGRMVNELEAEAAMFINRYWLLYHFTEQAQSAHLMTTPESYRLPIRKQLDGLIQLVGPIPSVMAVTKSCLPADRAAKLKDNDPDLAFNDLYNINFFRPTNFFSPEDDTIQFKESTWTDLKAFCRKPRFMPISPNQPRQTGGGDGSPVSELPTTIIGEKEIHVEVMVHLVWGGVKYSPVKVGIAVENQEMGDAIRKAFAAGGKSISEPAKSIYDFKNHGFRIAYMKSDMNKLTFNQMQGPPGGQ
jgi:hypothetical protein